MSTCHICGVSFANNKALYRHKKADHETFCPYPQCKKGFPTTNALRAHKVARHPQRCTTCRRPFASQEELHNHWTAEHAQWCTTCGKSFGSQKALDNHRMAIHSPQRHNIPRPEYKCDKCNTALRSPERLEQHHEKVHAKCHMCNGTFYAKGLARHLRKVHGVVIKCNYCTKTFKCFESLNQHEAAKHASLVASTSRTPMGCSSSGSSGLSVVDDPSLSSPSTVYRSDSSNDSDAELLESQSASGSQASMIPELSKNNQPTVTRAHGIPESGHDNHFVMSDVQIWSEQYR